MTLISEIYEIKDPLMKSMITGFCGRYRGLDETFYNNKSICTKFYDEYQSDGVSLCALYQKDDQYFYVSYNDVNYDLEKLYVNGRYTQLAEKYCFDDNAIYRTFSSPRTFSLNYPMEMKLNVNVTEIPELDYFDIFYTNDNGQILIDIQDEETKNLVEVLLINSDNPIVSEVASAMSDRTYARRNSYGYSSGSDIEGVTESLEDYLKKQFKNDWKEYKKERSEKKKRKFYERYEKMIDWFKEDKNKIFLLAITPSVVAVAPLALGVAAGAGAFMFGKKKWYEISEKRKEYLENLDNDYYLLIKGKKSDDNQEYFYKVGPMNKNDVNKEIEKQKSKYVEEPTYEVIAGRYNLDRRWLEETGVDMSDKPAMDDQRMPQDRDALHNSYDRSFKNSDGIYDFLTDAGFKLADKSDYEKISEEFKEKVGTKDIKVHKKDDLILPDIKLEKGNRSFKTGIQPWITEAMRLNLDDETYNKVADKLRHEMSELYNELTADYDEGGKDKSQEEASKDILHEFMSRLTKLKKNKK